MLNKFRARHLLIPFIIALTGCSVDDESTSALQDDLSPLAIQPAEGYDLLAQKATNHICIDSDVQTSTPSAAISWFEKVDSSSALERKLGFKMEGSFTYGLAKGDAKASLLHEAKQSNRALTFLLHSQVTTKVRISGCLFVGRRTHVDPARATIQSGIVRPCLPYPDSGLRGRKTDDPLLAAIPVCFQFLARNFPLILF